MIAFVNRATGALVDGLLWPFQSRPLLGLAVVSVGIAVLALVVFRMTTDRNRFVATKRQMQAGLFELRLFRSDPVLVLRVAGSLLGRQAAYLRLLLWPLVVAALLLTPLLAQLDAHFSREGLRPGEPALLKVRMANASGAGEARPAVTLEAPAGIVVQSPAVWTPSLGEIAWRIAATTDGEYELRITVGSEMLAKQVTVSPAIVRRSPVRPRASFWAEVLHAAEPPIPAHSSIAAIEITYPERSIEVLGLSLPWIAVVLVLSWIAALVLRPLFGVEF